jgi:hypothetical protein
MLNKTSKLVLTFFVTMLITTGLSLAQDHGSKDHKHGGNKKGMSSSSEMDSTKMDMSKGHMNMDHKAMMDSSKMNKDHKHMDHDKMMGSDHKKMMKDNKSIVHEGIIDLTAIDENGDGKVYQDQMCWNVVSDISGDCPQCGMKLKEVSLEDAKKNLEKNGFDVK